KNKNALCYGIILSGCIDLQVCLLFFLILLVSRIFSIKITGYKTPEKTTNEKMMIRMVSEYSNRTVLSGDYDRDDLMILADTCLQMSIAGVENRTYNVKILTKVRKLCSQMYGPVAKCTDRQVR